MTTMERESVAAICLLAAFADGAQSDSERARMRTAMEQLGEVSDGVFQRVTARRTTLEEEARCINDPVIRQLAYELAVGVCNSDGQTTDGERAFLAQLAGALQITPEQAAEAAKQAEGLAEPRLNGAEVAGSMAAVPAVAATASGNTTEKEIDETILKYAAVNAGLELLPQSLATVAIVPLQTRMVYLDRKSTRLNSSHLKLSRMPSSA